MNNLPLQPLVWTQSALTHTAESPLHSYIIRYDELEGAYLVDYYERMTGEHGDKFCKSVDDAKHWIATDHYPSKMQPYVKPSPTWIDASEKLPQVDVDTQFICAYDSAIEPYVKVTYFDKSLNEFDHEHEGVLAWMLIPEFSTMQILHKGE